MSWSKDKKQRKFLMTTIRTSSLVKIKRFDDVIEDLTRVKGPEKDQVRLVE